MIQSSAVPRMKPLSCPSQFILWQQRMVKNNFQEKEASHSILVFQRHFVTTCCYYMSTTLLLEKTEHWNPGILRISAWSKNNFSCWIHCNQQSTRNSIHGMYEWSSLTPAHSNYYFALLNKNGIYGFYNINNSRSKAGPLGVNNDLHIEVSFNSVLRWGHTQKWS